MNEENCVTLADGTVIPDAYVSKSAGSLFIYATGATMLWLCEVLSDREKTSFITAGGIEYEGYTDLFILQKSESVIGCGLARE